MRVCSRRTLICTRKRSGNASSIKVCCCSLDRALICSVPDLIEDAPREVNVPATKRIEVFDHLQLPGRTQLFAGVEEEIVNLCARALFAPAVNSTACSLQYSSRFVQAIPGVEAVSGAAGRVEQRARDGAAESHG